MSNNTNNNENNQNKENIIDNEIFMSGDNINSIKNINTPSYNTNNNLLNSNNDDKLKENDLLIVNSHTEEAEEPDIKNNIETYNNNINNNNEIENINEEENEEEEETENIPLITLKYISICQCCKNSFNSYENVPFLFKCGHFFCKKCIEENFTDEEGIKCPNDGLIAFSINELKLLSNLINDNNNNDNNNFNNENLCEIHKEKFSHFVEDSNEIVCVYCAFERFKKNQNVKIKEIKEKCNEIIKNVDNIIEDNQKNVENIQIYLKNIKKNKETEEKKNKKIF